MDFINAMWTENLREWCGQSSLLTLMNYVDGLICAYLGYLCLGKDVDLPFNIHLEALDWSGSNICGLLDSVSTTCQYGST